MGNCAGEEFAAIAGICILSSYLVLFIGFYAATYKKSPAVIKKRGRATSALIEMKDEKVPTVGQTVRRFSGGASTLSRPKEHNGFATSSEPQTPGTRYSTRSRKA
jgi:fatty acid elongase 3